MKNSYKLFLFFVVALAVVFSASASGAQNVQKTQKEYIPDTPECKEAFKTLPIMGREVADYINENDIDLIFREKLHKHQKLMLFIITNCNMDKESKLTLSGSISENAETLSIVERHLKKKGIL